MWSFSLNNLQITKPIGGKAAGTASWATNVGNEDGQVLKSALTESERDGLGNMATGLMPRYRVVATPSKGYVCRQRLLFKQLEVLFQRVG